MGNLFTLKCLFIRIFKPIQYQQCFIIKTIFEKSSIDYLQQLEIHFSQVFNTQFYNYVFEAAIYKKNLAVIQYLIDKTDFNIVQNKKIIHELHNKILTDNLKQDNYFAWLAIISSHSNLQLLGLEKNYHYDDYFNIVAYLLRHDKLKHFFYNEYTKELILSYCHDNAKKMFQSLFLELKLSNKKALQNVVPYKVVKI